MKKQHFIIRAIAAFFISFLLFDSVSAKESADGIVVKLQGNYQAMKSYGAKFHQKARVKAYPMVQESSGDLFFKKPGKIRWNYEAPERQEIVSDGKTVWLYTPSLNQVMKTDFSTANQSKVASIFLSGMGNLNKDFDVSLEAVLESANTYKIVLIPKDRTDSVKSLVLTVDRISLHITSSELTDIYGNITTVSFTDIRFDIEMDDSIFDFKPPAGVEITSPPEMP